MPSRARGWNAALIMAEPEIDVLIPVFNGSATVRSAVASIQAQTIRDIRIIVIDDGSTDGTAEILASMSRDDPRIEVVTQPNGGIVDALNLGLSRCRSAFIARHDADDLADPRRFATQLAYLKSHPDCVAVGGAVRHIDEKGRRLGHVVRLPSIDLADPHWAPSREPYLMHPFLMTYRASLEGLGGYRYVFHSEDTDLYWRLLDTGRLHNLEEVLGDYRMHAQSVSAASIVNGRVAALNSQLAGISELRRRGGLADLEFPKERGAEYVRARSLQAIFEVGARQLTDAETDHLEIALAGKMVELTSYRPFELDIDDCRFIRRAMLRRADGLTPANLTMLHRMSSGAAARLAGRGRLKEAAALVAPRLYLGVLGRIVFRTLGLRSLRRLRQRSIDRPDYAK